MKLEKTIGNLLKKRGWTLSVAESCTGGLVSDRITNVPGSSEYFLGGMVNYSNESKAKHLGVSLGEIRRHGAVSSEVARKMAQGVRKTFGATFGLSTTGVAGPTGRNKEKSYRDGLSVPVGFPGWRRAWFARVSDRRMVAHIDLWSHPVRFAEHRCLLGMGVCTDKGSVLREIARSLALPSWFGMNLDALYDSLTDLPERQTAEGYVIALEQLPRTGDFGADERDALLEVFRDAAESFAELGIPFPRVFHS